MPGVCKQAKYPPLCAGICSKEIGALDVQNWAFGAFLIRTTRPNCRSLTPLVTYRQSQVGNVSFGEPVAPVVAAHAADVRAVDRSAPGPAAGLGSRQRGQQ